MSSSKLFSPVRLGPVELTNRIMVSPMCQYSADNGMPVPWHFSHLGALAISGAGLLCMEATAVCPEGRITPGCLGLWSDEHEAAFSQLVGFLRALPSTKLAIQLSHAGRKASSLRPWEGGSLIPSTQGGWQTVAPSAVPHKPEEPAPLAMTEKDILKLVADFASAAARARRLGFQAIELHMAHGYLLHQFMSPLSNRRTDHYGGSLDNRLRLPLEVLRAVREAAGTDIAVGARLSATDWVDGGWDLAQTIELARSLQDGGCDFLDISSGGLSWQQKISIGPGYQVQFAEAVKQAVTVPVVTVGLITTPRQAEDIISLGQADLVALGRAFMHEPRWPWRAAAELGATVRGPQQMYRCLPSGHPPIFGDTRTGQR